MDLAQITEHVIAGNKAETAELVRLAGEGKESGKQIIDALIQGIHLIGEKWSKFEVFIPEVLKASNAMKAGMKALEPYLQEGEGWTSQGVVVIGTVKGDQHDIGKNIVSTMLTSVGFDVHDIGVDKPAAMFIEKAREVSADIIAVSSLLTTTMQGQRDIIDLLQSTSERSQYKVIVGGGPVTQSWAESIGADGYGETAAEAIIIAKKLIADN